ncbi:MAG TPA: hypothetical protein DCG64_03010 [Alphaproteobacteria bacterium]|nr:hypothetical protein [Alphaproteobacteria bacterium]
MKGAISSAGALVIATIISVWLSADSPPIKAMSRIWSPAGTCQTKGSETLSATEATTAPHIDTSSGSDSLPSLRFSSICTATVKPVNRMKIAPISSAAGSGRITSSTPQKPPATPAQAGRDTGSPSIKADSPTIRKG